MEIKLKKKYTDKKAMIRNGNYRPRTGSRPIKGKNYSNSKLHRRSKRISELA